MPEGRIPRSSKAYFKERHEYMQHMGEIKEELKGFGYPEYIVNTVIRTLNARNPYNTQKEFSSVFNLPRFRSEQMLYKGVDISMVDKDNADEKRMVAQPKELDMTIPLKNNDSKVIVIFGIDTGDSRAMADDFKKGRELIDNYYIKKTMAPVYQSLEGDIEKNADNFLFAIHNMNSQDKFELIWHIQNGLEYSHPVVDQFANDVMIPMMLNDNQEPSTILTHSFGGAFIQAAQLSAVKNLRSMGIKEPEIQQKFDDTFRVFQLGYSSVCPALDKDKPRIRTYGIMEHNDLIPPMETQIYGIMDDNGKMKREMNVTTFMGSRQIREVILNSEQTRQLSGAKNAGHVFYNHIRALVNRPILGKFFKAILNNDPEIRNNKVNIDGIEGMGGYVREITHDNSIKRQTLNKIARVFADQLKIEVDEKIYFLREKKGETEYPTDLHAYKNHKDVPHPFIQGMGGSLISSGRG